MGLDSKKDVHLDGSSVRPVSRLEVLEGPTGRRVRSEAERARIAAESLLPVRRCPRWHVSTARHAGRFTIGDGGFDGEGFCRRAMRRSRHSRRWSWKVRWRSVTFRRSNLRSRSAMSYCGRTRP